MQKLPTLNLSPEYGLCCISLTLKAKGVGYRRLSFSNYMKLPGEKAETKLAEICLGNAQALRAHIEFCAENSIRRYRIPSDIFPLLNHPTLRKDLRELPNFIEIKNALRLCGDAARSGGVGLSTHPSQFAVLASAKESVARSAADDANLNALTLDLIGAPKSPASPINLHISRSPQHAENFKADFLRGLKMLNKSARARIAFENEDKGFWNIKNLLDFLDSASKDKSFGERIPVVLDFHHNKINPSGLSEEEAFFAAAATWGNLTPICHYSESAGKKQTAAHSDFCRKSPPFFGVPYHCMLEAKAKDLAIFRLMNARTGAEKKVVETGFQPRKQARKGNIRQ